MPDDVSSARERAKYPAGLGAPPAAARARPVVHGPPRLRVTHTLLLVLGTWWSREAGGQTAPARPAAEVARPRVPAAGAPGGAPAGRTDSALTDSAVGAAAARFLAAPQAVGLSVGVYHGGRLRAYHFGEAVRGSGRPPTARSLYAIASVTKTFTATLLAQAVVEGRVSLQDDVRRYLDGAYPNLAYRGAPVRLVHLVNHNSGLPFLLPNIPEILTDTTLSLTDVARRIDRPVPRAAFFGALRAVALDTAPGARTRYSNAAVQLLGFVLEKVYATPFETLLAAKILRPLGMIDTRLALGPSDRRRLVPAYDEAGHAIPANTSTFGAAAGLSSTADDMLRYVRWQVGEGAPAVRLAHAPVVGDFAPYALGLNWRMLRKGDARVLWQDGNMIGYSSLCVLHPELDLGVVVLTNEMDRGSAGRVARLANEVAAAVSPRAVPLP